MLERLNTLIISSKKAGDKFTATVLTTLKAELLNNQKAKRPSKELEVVRAYKNKLVKGSEAFAKTEQYSDLLKEIALIETFLPVQLTAPCVEEKVKEYLATNKIEDKKGIGLAIKTLKSELGDQNGANIAKFVMKNAGVV